MALPSIAGAYWFEYRVDVKQEKRCFYSISTVCFCIKQPDVYDQVLLIIRS